MLVLTRKNQQSVMIGDDVEVTIVAIDSGKVRVGIAAPKDVGIWRTEVYRAREQKDAARREVADALKRRFDRESGMGLHSAPMVANP